MIKKFQPPPPPKAKKNLNFPAAAGETREIHSRRRQKLKLSSRRLSKGIGLHF